MTADQTYFYKMKGSEFTPINAFIVMKSWYSPRYGPYSVQYTKAMRGYTYKPDADKDAEVLNQECVHCPRRTAQKTRYWVDDRRLNVRIRNR